MVKQLAAFDEGGLRGDPSEWPDPIGPVRAARSAAARIAVIPAERALAAQPPDYANAEKGLRQALRAFPESSYAAFRLGAALLAQQESHPDKIAAAIYEIARAIVLDPTIDGTADPAAAHNYIAMVYGEYHGTDEGFRELLKSATLSPFPLEGFHLASAREAAASASAAQYREDPQMAGWLEIISGLTDLNGTAYFRDRMKNKMQPSLRGVVTSVQGSTISVNIGYQPEPNVVLRLDRRLPELAVGALIEWTGVALAFDEKPFSLTIGARRTAIKVLENAPSPASY